MSVTTLNNNAVATVLKEAFKQAVGTAEVDTLDLQGIIDTGNDANVIGSREQFTKALINVVIKNWFTDSSYRSQYTDPFYQDSEAFGAITQNISVDVPEVMASHVWTDITSGTTQVGAYTVYLPVVHTQYYGKSNSWELPICVTEEQWNTAWKNEGEMRSFIAYILMCVDNALVVHMENMDNMNRNNFIAEKFAYAESADATGIHIVDLVKEYATAYGKGSTTVEEFLADADALRFASEKISLYKDYFGKMSTLFNTAGRKRFTPNDRIVLQVLSEFEKKLQYNVYSDTYHNELVKLPNYQSIPYWQGEGEGLSFAEVSKIDVKSASDGTEVSKNGIVAFLCDKWAILHTIVSRRIAAKVFEPEALTQYYYQFTDRYLNDLTMNAVVFQLTDYTAE